jgi:hypothetical protein
MNENVVDYSKWTSKELVERVTALEQELRDLNTRYDPL